jgi:UDP-galactopyranose mutase
VQQACYTAGLLSGDLHNPGVIGARPGSESEPIRLSLDIISGTSKRWGRCAGTLERLEKVLSFENFGKPMNAPPQPSEFKLRDHCLMCFSHLRWDLVFQRPQHLMTRFAQSIPVFFIEEPAFEGREAPHLRRYTTADNLSVFAPHLPEHLPAAAAASAQRRLVTDLLRDARIGSPVIWYYTPMALQFSDALDAAVTVYDCMDELSAFQDAPPELRRLEAELLHRADVVFTGGISLYEAKRARHHNVHAFPSAVDAEHFGKARARLRDPLDQAGIPRPRLGFFGVIDERLDRELLAAVARLRPDWHVILVGPVVKIDPASLPRAANIHYLGGKPYGELPAYIANWDVAVMPFARNEATRFISPTKTPEYLAGGRPVVSTPVIDVVRRWGHLDAVGIAETPADFVAKSGAALALPASGRSWLEAVDRELAEISWDRTWAQMATLVAQAGNRRASIPTNSKDHYSDQSENGRPHGSMIA